MYYTYGYCDPTKESNLLSGFGCNFEPFYIGHGKDGRMFHHLGQFADANAIKNNVFKCDKIKYLFDLGIIPIIIKLKSFKTKSEAINHEDSLIISIGTVVPINGIPIGPLTNKRSNRLLSDETKEKMSIAKRGVILSDDHKNKITKSVTKSLLDPIKRKKISVAHKGKPKSKSHKEKLQIHLSKMNSNPEIITRKLETRSETYPNHSEETKSKISSAIKEKMKDSEYRKKIGAKSAKTFKLTDKSTNESFVITNLKEYCRNNNIKYYMVHKEFIVEKLISK